METKNLDFKKEILGFRMTSQEKSKLRAIAKTEHLSLSSFARKIILEYLDKCLQTQK
jgi:hypothetical protein